MNTQLPGGILGSLVFNPYRPGSNLVLKNECGLVQLIRIGQSIHYKWVKHAQVRKTILELWFLVYVFILVSSPEPKAHR